MSQEISADQLILRAINENTTLTRTLGTKLDDLIVDFNRCQAASCARREAANVGWGRIVAIASIIGVLLACGNFAASRFEQQIKRSAVAESGN